MEDRRDAQQASETLELGLHLTLAAFLVDASCVSFFLLSHFRERFFEICIVIR